MNRSYGSRSLFHRFRRSVPWGFAALLHACALLSLSSHTFAQASSQQQQAAIVVEGTVRNASGEPVSDAFVFLEERGGARLVRTNSNPDGSFLFSLNKGGTYSLRAEKNGLRSAATGLLALKSGDHQRCDVVLTPTTAKATASTDPREAESASATTSATATTPTSAGMVLADEPTFTVAGVTDWSNAGLHGSDTRARTSDALAKETLALKSGHADKTPSNPPNASYKLALEYRAKGDFARARDEAQKSLAISDAAAGHRLLGELDERMGDPVAAVREFEGAARIEPSEQSYLDWGAELLLHKAAQPAVQVFTKGSSLHPDSARLLAGLGAALFAAGSYDEAAQRLCAASDLSPSDPTPYLFLGKMEESATTPAPCGEEKLARFVQQQPENALANYYYAKILWKRERGADTQAHLSSIEALLEKAARLDPNLAQAYVQLGMLRAARGDFASAIDAYKKAIAVNPDLAEAHYQLSLVYKRTGEDAKAREEFRAYQQAEKSERAEVERQRHDLRQFVITLKEPSASPAAQPAPPPR
jgi:tetratricopeptide (TPR) repeat protein